MPRERVRCGLPVELAAQSAAPEQEGPATGMQAVPERLVLVLQVPEVAGLVVPVRELLQPALRRGPPVVARAQRPPQAPNHTRVQQSSAILQ